ncbi:MAG: molybdopterin oxidoreductase [Pseudomonadota bacterium]
MHTTCLGCHSHCCIKAKVYDGVLVKLDGSPYGPNGRLPHLPFDTSLEDEALSDGKMCLKGQSGIHVQYDPYRITQVLKRAGQRGENKWTTISFDQAIDEIVNGGALFANVPGEESRHVDGLKDIWALRDAEVAKEMAADVKHILQAPQGEEKAQAVADFKEKFSNFEGQNWLDTLIDPDHPDLGPKNNQLLWFGGRVQYGREAFTLRWMYEAFGSVNWVNHCTVCGGSHRCGHALHAMQFDPEDGMFKNAPGKPDICYLSADFLHTEFLILFGHSLFEANYGPTHLTQRVTDGIASGRLTLVVVDPRLSKTAARAHKWIAPIPATDGALVWGMIRWIMENEAYDARFLANANKAAAKADGETAWPNGVYLVKIESDGPGKMLRAKEIGLEDSDKVVVMQNGQPVAVDPNDEENAVEGDLYYDGTLSGVRVKTAWQIIREYAFSKSLDEWAQACGVEVETITWLASEFAAHGKKSVADAHRGLATNGWGALTVLAMDTLNTLVGNMDWKGGFSKGGGSWDFKGGKPGQPYNLGKLFNPAKLPIFGIPLSKQHSMKGVGYLDLRYENTTLFEGYPARRPWYGPAKWGIYQEPLPAGAQGYPYPIKAVWLACWATPLASIAGAQPQIDILADVNKIPLVIANDLVIGESSMYADYLFPDLSYLEELQVSKWPSSNLPHTANPIRQPVVAPVVDNCVVYGQEMPICLESVHMAFAEKLGMPGFGKDGFGPGDNFVHFDQFYLKMAANVAWGHKEDDSDTVPEAGDAELAVFRAARQHLPATIYDYDRWRLAAGDAHWRRVVYILNRGGRFESFEKAYSGDHLGHKYGKMLTVYNDLTPQMIHPGTGKRLPGIGEWHWVEDFHGRSLLDMDKEAGYEFILITYKIVGGANYRGMSPYYWPLEVTPENFVVMHQDDAARAGLQDGDMVKLVSASNPEGMWDLKNGTRFPCGGKVKTTTGIRSSVVAVAWSFGHWAYGATDVVVDGEVVKGDPRRGAGLNPNVVFRLDPVLKDVAPADPVGGQLAVPTRVNVMKMTPAEIAQLQSHVPGQVFVQGLPKTYLGGA